MKRLTFIAVLLAAMAPIAHAKDVDPAVRGGLADGGATAAAKTHLRGFLEGDFKMLAKTYAIQVTLMPGSEMLKPDYGLVGVDGRGKATTIDRAKLIAAMKKAFADRPVAPAEKIDRIFKTFGFNVLETGIGDFVIDPADPIGGLGGKLRFTIKDGDVLLKVGPEKGDFVLFQFRPINGRWQVVAEYLD